MSAGTVSDDRELELLEWKRQRLEVGDLDKSSDFEDIITFYFDRAAEAAAQRGEVLVRVYCNRDNPRRTLGAVFESPLGPLYEQSLGDPPRIPGRSSDTQQLVLLARVGLDWPPPRSPRAFWLPRVHCRDHGGTFLDVGHLTEEAAKAVRRGGPGRLLVRCGDVD
jgi:hypothetical protein